MKLFFVLALILLPALAEANHIPGHVRGYIRRDGTYVPDYNRTLPNDTSLDNFNTPGNFNPNKGEITPGNFLREIERDRQRQIDRQLEDLLRRK